MRKLLIALAAIAAGLALTGCSMETTGVGNDKSGYKYVCNYSGKCGIGYDHGNGFVTHSNGQTGLGFGF